MTTPKPQIRKAKAVEPEVEEFIDLEPEVAEPIKYREFQPRDILNFEGQLWVKNVSPSFVSFDDSKGNIFKLGKARTADQTIKYAGEPSIKALPTDVARHPGFQKFWRKGNLVVTDNPDIELEMDVFEAQDIEIDRLQQAFVNGLISKPQAMDLKMPFPIQGLDPRYPNPNAPAAVRTY